MPMMPFLLMTKTQAARFREETSNDTNRLDPRPIEAGTHAGKYALPERVIFDPAFEDRRDALRMLEQASFDTETAWPVKSDPS